MPVRIYDIAKKLGVENKVVLSKAKELGISAKVPSSSLDKITAEYLEEQLQSALGLKPVEPAPPGAPAPAPETEIRIVSAPEAPPETIAPPTIPAENQPAPLMTEATDDLIHGEAVPDTTPEVSPAVPDDAHAGAGERVQPAAAAAPELALPEAPAPAEEPAASRPPAPPPLPPKPGIGEKVGFIQLPTRPAPRGSDRDRERKVVRPPTPPQPQQQARQDFQRRGDMRQGRPALPGRKIEPQKPATPQFVPPSTGEMITIKPPVIVRDLAERLTRKPFQIIADLMEMGVFATVNQSIDEVAAQRVCAKYGFRFELERRERGGGIVHTPLKKVDLDIEDKPEEMVTRAPVVTIMGHVDHGKTTLLDTIRKSKVAAGEAGGITQHIGAYTIAVPHPDRKADLQQITFLDTPGHAAFSAMRARGANVTDIVVLVVAANDGVMPQTMEAFNHAKAAKVPIIVAVNKCDHPNANSMRARQQLQEKGLVPEEWGGDAIFRDVSALTGEGVEKLLEMILLQAEIMELKANPNRKAIGNVIESGLEPGGPTATVLVRKGTLRIGDSILCGPFWGRVRALIDEEGKRLKEAGPSTAVKVLGMNGVPEAGLEFNVVADEKTARALAEERAVFMRTQIQEKRAKVTLENLFATLDANAAKTLNVVVKADAQGSVEAIVDALKKIPADKVSIEVIHSAVGNITESDVTLASASNAIILGFHSRMDVGVADAAKHEGVQIKLYSIIYELIDEVKEAMAGLLEPISKETVLGTAEVRKVFELSKGGKVAGCMVANGRINRGKARVIRRKSLIYDGGITSLRRFQDEVNEVRAGMECGIRIDGFNDFEEGDLVESYSIEKVAQKL